MCDDPWVMSVHETPPGSGHRAMPRPAVPHLAAPTADRHPGAGASQRPGELVKDVSGPPVPVGLRAPPQLVSPPKAPGETRQGSLNSHYDTK